MRRVDSFVDPTLFVSTDVTVMWPNVVFTCYAVSICVLWCWGLDDLAKFVLRYGDIEENAVINGDRNK